MSNLYQLHMESTCVVWLTSHDADDSTINSLGSLWKAIFVLNNVDQCLELMRLINEEKVILIISEDRLQEIVPLAQSLIQIHSIYIYSKEQLDITQLKSNWSKIEGSFSNLSYQCRLMERFSCASDSTPISVNILPADQNVSNQSSNQFDSTFMWTQLFKELITSDRDHPGQLEKMFDYFRDKFANNESQRQKIDKLQRDYPSRRPIYWYTKEPLFYQQLNEALRGQDMETIIRYGPFIRDLDDDLKRAQLEKRHSSDVNKITVYRGQSMSKADFDRVLVNKGCLLSFNCFLSTSIAADIGDFFAQMNRKGPSDQTSVSVLFTITVDTSRPRASFAWIDDLSNHPTEQEVLFSTHTIFRVKDVKLENGNDGIPIIELELTDENDERLKKITERFRLQLDHGLPSRHRIASLLQQLMRGDLALKLYRELLDFSQSEEEAAFLHGRIGCIESNEGRYTEAELSLKQAISTYKNSIVNSKERQFLTPRHAAEIYSAMGTVYQRLNDLDNTLTWYMEAILTDPNVLETYFQVAAVHTAWNEHSEALKYYEMVLSRLKGYHEDHPDVAFTHHKMACTYMAMNKHEEALEFFQKALDSRERTRHPSLGQSYIELGACHGEMKNYFKAHDYFNKALHFYEKWTGNHRDLSLLYRKLGKFNRECRNYDSALEMFNKSLEIMQEASMDPDYDFAHVYYEKAIAHLELGEYNEAESWFTEALKIWQKYTSETAEARQCYIRIADLCHRRGCYLQALLYLNNALELCKRIGRKDPSNLVAVLYNIGGIHAKMGAFCQARFCWNSALKIASEKLSGNDPVVKALHENMARFGYLCDQERGA